MVSNNLEDYEVLSILGADLNSTCYKVKHKTTSEIFVWKAIGYENYTESEKQTLLSQVEKQKLLDHPHLLQVHDYILHEETKILYLVSEFCSNGNLYGIVQKCIIENEYLSEDFLWRTLYQIACALKIRGNMLTNLSLNNIFMDGDYKVKLFNNDISNLQETEKIQNLCFGPIMFELCTLQPQKFVKKNNSVSIIKQILTEIPSYYSNELKEIIKFTMTTNFSTKEMIDAILCHPTILLKSQAKINNIYFKNPLARKIQIETTILENSSNAEIEAAYHLRLENLKNREIALKIREEKLAEKAHELHKREKKIALSERMVREKMLHAELYLKRCREVRSTSSGSNKSGSFSNKISSYENIDTSFSADCGDSSLIMPTSNRMNLHVVKKPSNFIRAMSERRVRFKGHSPLKDMCMRNNNFKEPRSLQNFYPIKETNSTSASEKSTEENSFKSVPNLEEKSNKVQKKSKSRKKLDLFSGVLPVRSRKPLVEVNAQNNVIYEESEGKNGNVQFDYRPVSWTEESKQHAFDLLRIMNQGEESEIVKHTYL